MTESLEERVFALLQKSGNTLSVAESCTGGMIGALLTNVAGVSRVFVGGVVAYNNGVKAAVLGVPLEVLESKGAVSPECVVAMAEGVRRALKTTCAISVSGIAGPDGGTPQKPVGLVFIGVATPQRVTSFEHRFSGGRAAVRQQAALSALQHLLNELSA
jgi:PncC family amidohydrolase